MTEPQKIFPRVHGVSEELARATDAVLRRELQVGLDDARAIAQAVQQLSDYFIANPGGTTPWTERWCQIAYLAYYTPLNTARMEAVLAEGARFGFFDDAESLLDFGAGLGSFGWAARSRLPNARVTEWEPQAIARGLARALRAAAEVPELPQVESVPDPGQYPTWVFSYSLIESGKLPKGAQKAEKLVLLEPSTREQGRQLQKLRSNLLNNGFHAWAPCPHEEDCPLLKHSEKDWCHDRIHFEAPDWLRAIESHLPVKNHTLTYSYLLMAERPSPLKLAAARAVGDLLPEKGKDRQLICQNSERIFLTWMHRDWPHRTEIPRGTLLSAPAGILKGNELRATEPPRVLEQFP